MLPRSSFGSQPAEASSRNWGKVGISRKNKKGNRQAKPNKQKQKKQTNQNDHTQEPKASPTKAKGQNHENRMRKQRIRSPYRYKRRLWKQGSKKGKKKKKKKKKKKRWKDEDTNPQGEEARKKKKSTTQRKLHDFFEGWNDKTMSKSVKRKKRRAKSKPNKTQREKHEKARRMRQTNLKGETMKDEEEYFDKISRIGKPMQHIRVTSHNKNRLPIRADPTTRTRKDRKRNKKIVVRDKNKEICEQITTTKSDITLMQEVGLNWGMLPAEDQWSERKKKRLPSTNRSTFAYNKNDINTGNDPTQYGGTGVITIGEATARVIDTGEDTTRLGRWSWARLKGKNGSTSRWISVYAPVKPSKKNPGPSTVWRQHERYLLKKNRLETPTSAFWTDLEKDIRKWQDKGDSIIIGGDINDDVLGQQVTTFFKEVQMKNAILDRHNAKASPATCAKTNQRKAIDGIWVSNHIQITNGGYGGFEEGSESDHRYLWIDIPFRQIFGNNPPHIYHKDAKDFTTKDPRQVRKYNREVRKEMEKQNLHAQMRHLKELVEEGKDIHMIKEAHDKALRTMRRIRKDAAKRVRKKRVGGIPYSPKIQDLRDKLEMWRYAIKRKKGKSKSSRKLRRLIRKCKAKDVYKMELQELREKEQEARKEYRTARKEAPAWRKDFLNGLANAIAKKKGTKKRTEKKNLIRIEEQRAQARRIKRLKKIYRGQVTKVIFKDKAGRDRECTTKQEMETACKNENTERQTQCRNTPFVQKPLLDHIGWLPSNKIIQDILDGIYKPPEGTDIYAKFLIEGMKMPRKARENPLSPKITKQEHIQMWRRQKEDKAAEPDGLTFADYIAGTYDEKIADYDATLRSIPREFGFSPPLWQRITDVEILKKANVYVLEKMRLIQLMYADFNANNKHDGKRVMEAAERNGTINKGAIGGRKNHSGSGGGLLKVLFNDKMRTTGRPGGIISNDAKSCFDRIVHSVAMICLARQGMDKNAIRTLFETLQEAVHHISTAFGVSEDSYGGKSLREIMEMILQGIGQGNGAGPTVWDMISTVIIEKMIDLGYGSKFATALSDRVIEVMCFSFIDDADLGYCASEYKRSAEELTESLQDIINTWEGLLAATGGALVPSKSFFYLIDFKWDGTEWRYKQKHELPGEIVIRDHNKNWHPLKRHEPDHPEVTLGINLAADGNSEGVSSYLKEKVDEFIGHLRGTRLDRNDVWKALETTILKTLRYPMTATTLSKPQWETIMTPLIKATLPRAGYVRSFPHSVLYGPTEQQGLGIQHPWLLQELIHLETCISELNTDSFLQESIHNNWEDLRLSLGYPGKLHEAPYERLKECVPHTWLKTVWEFANKQDFQLFDEFPELQKGRENDQFLMEAFTKAGFSPTNLRDLNTARKQLQVITLADITTADGQKIDPEVWEGRPPRQTWHNYTWFRKPDRLDNRRHWDLWREALDKCFIIPSSHDRRLRQPLGRWIKPYEQNWKWWYSHSEHRVYHKTTTNTHGRHLFEIYRPLSRRLTGQRTTGTTFERTTLRKNSKPPDATPISARQRFHNTTSPSITITGIAEQGQPIDSEHTRSEVAKEAPLATFIQHLDEGEKWAVQKFVTVDQGKAIAEGITDNTAVAGSDGSHEERTGCSTSAFLIAPSITSQNEDEEITGCNQAPGERSIQSAYRAELAGILGILTILQAICDKYQITSGSILIGLDNLSAKQQAEGDWRLKPKQADYDMLTEIRERTKRLPIQCKWKWVEGHQDDNKDIEELDEWAIINMWCDQAAKAHRKRKENTTPTIPNQRFRYERFAIGYNGNKLPNFHINKLYNSIYKETLQHWNKRHQLTPERFLNTTDQHALGKAMKRMPLGKRRWLAKHQTGMSGVGRQLLRRKYQTHDKCPRCEEQDETTDHVIHCHSPRAKEEWDRQMTDMEKWLKKEKTEPDLARYLLKCIRKWKTEEDMVFPPHMHQSDPIRQALEEQHEIGWHNLLHGRVSKKITILQDQYFREIGRKTKGTTWTSKLITRLIDIQWAMWEHRNYILHHPKHPWKKHRHQDLQHEILQQLEEGDEGLLPQHKNMLEVTSDRVATWTAQQKEQWLTSVRNAKEAYRRSRAYTINAHTREHWWELDNEDHPPTAGTTHGVLEMRHPTRPTASEEKEQTETQDEIDILDVLQEQQQDHSKLNETTAQRKAGLYRQQRLLRRFLQQPSKPPNTEH